MPRGMEASVWGALSPATPHIEATRVAAFASPLRNGELERRGAYTTPGLA